MAYEIKKVSEIVEDFGLEEYGEGHTKFAEYCKFRMQKYTPNSTGDAGKWSNLNDPKIDAQCNLFYEEPYAYIQYYGIIWGHQVPKENYTTPGTGPYWDQEMLSAERNELVEDMTNWIKKRGNK